MADDLQYSSARTESKRKYEEQTTPPPPPPASSGPRRPTGFSAPITSQSPDSNPPPSYNSVPPPMDEIQLAKQRAQEIAARLFSNAEAKRPRLENGGPNDDPNDTKGFSSSAPSDLGQKALGQQLGQGGMGASSMPAAAAGYGFQGTSKKIEIPNGRVGVIIGKSGETIKYLQVQSGAKIQVTRDVDADLTSATRMVELMGTPEQISKAEQLINGVIAQAEAGGSNPVSRRFSGQTGGEQFQMKVPNNKVGLIIGKGGETIKNMQATSGARIQLIPLHLPPGDLSTERTVYIDGTNEQIEAAKQLVNEVISENRLRNPAISGGYNQQGHRPPQPPSWGPPGPPPMQQTSYGYMQPGAYPGPPPQYNNMSQPPYAGYPPQPTSSGWDQTGVPPSQQTTQGSGYDYYSQQTTLQQQAPHGGTSTNAGYNYNKPPAASYNQQQGSFGGFTYSQAAGGPQQSYPQDGYGGGFHTSASQPGYGQPQTNVQPGYDQSQGYNAAPSYGTGVSPAQDSAATAYGVQGGSSQIPPSQQVPPSVQAPPAAQQVYTSQQPNTPPSYTAQAGYPPTSQPGYGSQPPAQTGYGQSLPLTQPGYDQPQGQKPPGQAAYGQTQPPSSQGGYIQPSSVQPGYAHSQSLPTQSPAAQPDSSHHRPPPSGFGSGAPQAGYAQQPYGVPPAAAQPGYSQQQQQPYGDSYGGGYSQPPVYSNDSNVSGSAHGSYEAAAGAQPVQQSAVAKASPQS